MSEKITFKELVEKISKSTQQSEQSTNSFIHELTDIIESGLEKGEKITISGFGKFELRWMDQRKGRNPQTGEEITIPGQNKVAFKPYKALREHVNKPFKNLEPQIINESSDKNDDQDRDTQKTKLAESISYSETKKSEKTEDLDETIDDLVIERPSPVKSTIPGAAKNTGKPGESAKLDDDSGSIPINQPLRTKIEQNVPDPKTDNSAKFNWSYAAAALVMILGIFLLLFILFWPDEIDEQTVPELADQPASEQTPTLSTIYPPPSADDPSGESSVMEVHSINSGDTLWTISERSYGDPYLWPIIYENNSNEIDNPNNIIAGRSLTMPALSDPDSLTEKDKETVARGYLYVYDWMTDHQPDNAKYFLWAVGSYSREQLHRVSERVNETDLAFAIQQ